MSDAKSKDSTEHSDLERSDSIFNAGDGDSIMRLIQTRRNVRDFTDDAVPRAMLDQIVEAATWAPNHRHTEPWRFVVLEKDGAARSKVADLVYEWTWQNIKNPNPARREKSSADARDEVLDTPVLMLVYSISGANDEVTHENYAATCCAVQNMLLMAHAIGLAVGWSTGRICKSETVHKAVGAESDWTIVGAFFIGYPESYRSAERISVDEVCTYLA